MQTCFQICRVVLSRGYGPFGRLRKAVWAGFFAAAVSLGPAVSAEEAAQERLELLALGDSLTQGYGLAPQEGLVAQLQAWLRAQGADVEVVNAGVSGDTTSGGRARLAWSLGPGTDAVMIALGGNDMLRGLPPAQAGENLDAMLAEVRSRGLPVLLIGLAAPGNYGPAYQAAFDALWPDLAARHEALLLADLLAPIAALAPEERAAKGLMQADGIHPAPAGVALVVAQLGPKVLELLARTRPPE